MIENHSSTWLSQLVWVDVLCRKTWRFSGRSPDALGVLPRSGHDVDAPSSQLESPENAHCMKPGAAQTASRRDRRQFTVILRDDNRGSTSRLRGRRRRPSKRLR